MNEQEIREAVDACRPNGDDLHQPELSAVAELVARDPHWQEILRRTQQWDAVVGRAFQDVSVPEGLCERLLAAVTSSGSPTAIALEDGLTPEPAGKVEVAAPAIPAGRTAHRRWRTVAAALTVIAAGLGGALLLRGLHGRLPEPNDDFSREVLGWTELVQGAEWRQDLASAGCELDSAIRATPHRWFQLNTRYDAATVVYDLTPPGRELAFAFCIPARGRHSRVLPIAPPAVPFSTTGGVAIGVWQNADVVYVLAVQGSQNRYQGFINSQMLIGQYLGKGSLVFLACGT